MIPWEPGTEAPDRVAPQECIRAARDALNRAYASPVAPWPQIAEAVDWQRRALEQMVAEHPTGEPERRKGCQHDDTMMQGECDCPEQPEVEEREEPMLRLRGSDPKAHRGRGVMRVRPAAETMNPDPEFQAGYRAALSAERSALFATLDVGGRIAELEAELRDVEQERDALAARHRPEPTHSWEVVGEAEQAPERELQTYVVYETWRLASALKMMIYGPWQGPQDALRFAEGRRRHHPEHEIATYVLANPNEAPSSRRLSAVPLSDQACGAASTDRTVSP